jgi:hypothetical protein
MKINLNPRTNNQDGNGNETERFIEEIIIVFKSINYGYFFCKLIGKNQKEQKKIINKFQKYLQCRLNCNLPWCVRSNWEIEHKANYDCKDSFDLFTEICLDKINYKVIIELDKNRADQIAKKFLSRMSHTINDPTIYIAFCYPGTKKMSVTEAKKYFDYCLIITNKFNKLEIPKKFIGFIVERNK